MSEHRSITRTHLDAIRQFDTCRIANALETLDLRLRNEGYTRPGLLSLCGSEMSAIGFAVTARFKSAEIPATGKIYPDRTDWWDHIVATPAPRIAVLEDLDNPAGAGSFIGEVHAEMLRALGCAAVVTNGSVRDLPAARKMGFPLFARSTTVSHAYVHLVDFGGPANILDLAIKPGDLIYADCHGALSIPLAAAPLLPEIAARQASRERRVIDLCRSQSFSLEKLKAEIEDVL
jgi:4-hydroxy-4-methyl-2-oxoglutarate aldolase